MNEVYGLQNVKTWQLKMKTYPVILKNTLYCKQTQILRAGSCGPMKKWHKLLEFPPTTVRFTFWSLTSIWLQRQLLVLYCKIILLIQVSNDKYPNQKISAKWLPKYNLINSYIHSVQSQHNTEYTTHNKIR